MFLKLFSKMSIFFGSRKTLCGSLKSQGLTLDQVQLDLRNAFTGEAGMSYVALSRCRTPEGLRIIGTPDLLAKRIKVHPKALGWV